MLKFPLSDVPLMIISCPQEILTLLSVLFALVWTVYSNRFPGSTFLTASASNPATGTVFSPKGVGTAAEPTTISYLITGSWKKQVSVHGRPSVRFPTAGFELSSGGD